MFFKPTPALEPGVESALNLEPESPNSIELKEAEPPKKSSKLITENFSPGQEKETFPNPRAYKIWTLKNGKNIYADKYTEEQKIFIVHCIGHMMSPSETADAFKKEYGIVLNNPSPLLAHYKNGAKWQPIIEKVRSKYLAEVHAVAGSHKRVRLERGEKVYAKALEKGQLNVALASLEHQRKEMEEKSIDSVNLVFQQYNMMSDEQITERINDILQRVKTLKSKTSVVVETKGEIIE